MCEELQIREVSYASRDAQELTTEVQAEYARRYGGEGDIAPIDVREFDAPAGVFVIGYVDGEPAAMGGWRRGGPAGDSDVELKRMYVRPRFQRRGFARAILKHLEHSAGRLGGVTRLVLETGTAQPEAIELYRSTGFHTIAPFGFYAEASDSVHLAKEI